MNRREQLKLTAVAALAAAAMPSSFAQAKSHKPDIDRSRSALIFIEFQNEWLDPDAPLNQLIEDRSQFENGVRNAALIIEQARRSGFPVVHAGLSLVDDPTYSIFGGGHGKSGLKGAIPKAETWRDPQRVAYAEPFVPEPGEFVVAGRSGASVLTNSNLDAYLRNNRIDQIFLLGFALHVCVESTLRHAHDLGYEVTVVSDAAPAFTATQRDHVISNVIHHFGHDITTEQLLREIGAHNA